MTLIRPRRGWRSLDLKELWAYRELLWVLTMRDIKVRYKQTVLGVAWAVIQPFMTMVVFSIFFGRLAQMPSDGFPYPVFVYAALLPWTFFANALGSSGNSLLSSANLVSKVYFPRLIIPLASVGAGLIDFAISTVILLLLMWYYDVGWSANLLLAPALVLAVIFTALGVGTLLSALNVAYRDFRYVIPFLIQLWMFVTPVVYPASLVPERWQWLFHLNPMAGLIEGFRAAFLGRPFDGPGLLLSFTVAAVFFLAGVLYFEKVERGFADII
ncbi:MAG: ABC transporter permease [Candidatus Competibacter sp.]|nr:ABC transporter permease [Candidatus Contendobacter sp.]MDS4068181.1 ABC transporter permease [Candidatus Competibacter sp.]